MHRDAERSPICCDACRGAHVESLIVAHAWANLPRNAACPCVLVACGNEKSCPESLEGDCDNLLL
eukprot:scaffold21627_cov27-Tisochrysis_lutea.AAC.1